MGQGFEIADGRFRSFWTRRVTGHRAKNGVRTDERDSVQVTADGLADGLRALGDHYATVETPAERLARRQAEERQARENRQRARQMAAMGRGLFIGG